jgi:hypothetical protein
MMVSNPGITIPTPSGLLLGCAVFRGHFFIVPRR